MNRPLTDTDIVIIGAGPAGMKAASTAARFNASAVLLDEQNSPGGQIYRQISTALSGRAELLGADYQAGTPLADSLDDSNINYIPRAKVWRVEKDGSVVFSTNAGARVITGQHLIVATGAMERAVTIPGWTLPGVMGAGAGQILLKAHAMVPSRCVLAGAGPLLYLYACQLIKAGQPPLALVETQSPGSYCKALRFATGAIRARRTLFRGLGYLREIKKARVPRYTHAKNMAVCGEKYATGLDFVSKGKSIHIECDEVFLHQGIVPNTQISRSIGLEHFWDDRQCCFRPALQRFGATANQRISIAGDGGGIVGGEAAAWSGQLAALNALHRIEKISAQTLKSEAAPVERNLNTELVLRPFLDTLYRPAAEILNPDDAVVICTCEGVTAGQIRSYASMGCVGPNQVKAFGRCGMGHCQGRTCGLSVTQLLSMQLGQSCDSTGYYRVRAPLKPVTLAQLSELDAGVSAPPIVTR